MMARRRILGDNFQLKSFGISNDLTLLPPYWNDTNCLGGIHFNVAGLTDAPLQPASMVFVGAGIIEEKAKEDVECVSSPQSPFNFKASFSNPKFYRLLFTSAVRLGIHG
jgi:hypothetical protein